MNCEKIYEYILDLALDEPLLGEVLKEVGEHMDGCPRCREELEEVRRAWAALPSAEEVRFPGHLAKTVLKRLAREREAVPVFSFRRPLVRRRAYAWAAAALVAALALFLIFRPGGLLNRTDQGAIDRTAGTYPRERPLLPDLETTLDTYIEQAGDVLYNLERGTYDTGRAVVTDILSVDLQGKANYLLENLSPESPARSLVQDLHDAFWRILQQARAEEEEAFHLPPGVNASGLLEEIYNYREQGNIPQ